MIPEADMSMTSMALDAPVNRWRGDERLIIKFHILPMHDEEASAREGRPIYKDVEHVRIMGPGNKDNIPDRPVSDLDRQRFAQQYAAWKTQGEAEMVEGTMLDQVADHPMLRFSPAMVAEVKHFNVRTVEQLANIPDVHAQKFMGLAEMSKRAKAYLEHTQGASAMTQLQKDLKDSKNREEALAKAVEDLGNRLKAFEEASAAPKSRGRPPTKV